MVDYLIIIGASLLVSELFLLPFGKVRIFSRKNESRDKKLAKEYTGVLAKVLFFQAMITLFGGYGSGVFPQLSAPNLIHLHWINLFILLAYATILEVSIYFRYRRRDDNQ